MSLKGKTLFITGASRGIGLAIALRAARDGANIAIAAKTDTPHPKLEGTIHTVAAEIEKAGGKALAIQLDVRDEAAVAAAIGETAKKFGGLDILVNNAGLGLGRDPFDDSSEEDEETVLETNVHGLLRMTRLCLPHLRDGGHIVNMGSIAGRQAYENAAVYVASKFAVRGFTYALREDLLGRPIHLTTVDPGLVETNFSEVRFRGDTETAKKVYANVEPLAPEDIADCLLFALTRPQHVNVDEIVVKALAQSSGSRILRSA